MVELITDNLGVGGQTRGSKFLGVGRSRGRIKQKYMASKDIKGHRGNKSCS